VARKDLIVGNWKMNATHLEAIQMVQKLSYRLEPEDHERVKQAADNALSGSGPFSIDHRIILPSGEVRTVHEEGVVTFDDPGDPRWMHGTVQDVTERKAVEDALRDSEERHRSVITALDEGVIVQFAGGVIITCNASAERILGLSRDEILGRTSLDSRWKTTHEDGTPFPGETHPSMITLRTGEPLRDVVMGLHRQNGSLVWISVNSQPMFHAGEKLPYSVVT
jgi:PAS domain S-box-containing protein